jgi:hypothetical protein
MSIFSSVAAHGSPVEASIAQKRGFPCDSAAPGSGPSLVAHSSYRWPPMSRPSRKRSSHRREPEPPPSRFAPAAFLSGSPESVQRLCEDLAAEVAKRFADLTGTTWESVGRTVVEQLRRSGHDLSSFDAGEGIQEWQAVWHQPRGSFSLFLSFRAPANVEVIWKTDAATFTGRA